MENAFIAQRVNNQLRTTEAAIDAAILEANSLMSGIIQARTDANVSAVAADRELTRLTDALKDLNAARHNLVNVHHGLAKIANDLRVPVRMDILKPPMLAEEAPAEIREAV